MNWKNPLFAVRGRMASHFARYTTPEAAFPEATWTPHIAAESYSAPGLAGLPLAVSEPHFQDNQVQTRAGQSTVLSSALYYPEQNLIMTRAWRVIVPSRHGRAQMGHLDWIPFFRRRVVRVSGLTTTLRSFRWNYYLTLVDQVPMLSVLARALESGAGRTMARRARAAENFRRGHRGGTGRPLSEEAGIQQLTCHRKIRSFPCAMVRGASSRADQDSLLR